MRGGEWMDLLPGGLPGPPESKWCQNRLRPYLCVGPQPDETPGDQEAEEYIEVRHWLQLTAETLLNLRRSQMWRRETRGQRNTSRWGICQAFLICPLPILFSSGPLNGIVKVLVGTQRPHLLLQQRGFASFPGLSLKGCSCHSGFMTLRCCCCAGASGGDPAVAAHPAQPPDDAAVSVHLLLCTGRVGRAGAALDSGEGRKGKAKYCVRV